MLNNSNNPKTNGLEEKGPKQPIPLPLSGVEG